MKQTLGSIIIAISLFATLNLTAQEEQKQDTLTQILNRLGNLESESKQDHKLTINGYVQAQFESTGKDGSVKSGMPRNETEKGDINRVGIRRTRLKLAYKSNFASGQMELDASQKEFTLRDAYLKITDPWLQVASLNGGIFNRPFGYEIGYSTLNVESAERSRVITTLFPDEKDMGGMITLQGPQNTFWNNIKLEAGLFGGNGYRLDNDNRKDFIGHLAFAKSTSNIKYGFGVSLYDGFISQMNKKVYTASGNGFSLNNDTANYGGFAKRSYWGIDANLAFTSTLGITTIKTEYIQGSQPGTASDTKSPNVTAADFYKGDTYIRKVNGGYFHLIQDIGTTKHSITLKYDFYDPNTDVKGDDIGNSVSSGLTKTNKADIMYQTIGIGYFYRMNSNIRILVHYDYNINEKSANLSGYNVNRKDDVLTVRLQYKF